ncbi:hypothetical protein [Candidatus Nitrospira nitrificans]|uniref:Lipoprotein n=1 Tax=Candidatus Nitrospira nitrificans TaxID=1742973 RepID=A0A0S4LUE5_9BACT|nr:hypothetical protein [Candidatus Nitrospira nitrificans]CUS39636.1 conserved exported hypothetical protein [Candidatus Nitrospira nitrificans]
MMPLLLCLCIISAVLFSGCSRLLPPPGHDKTRSFESRCKPPSIHRNVSLTALEGPVGESGVVTEDLPDPEGFSLRALDAAYAIEALPLLRELHALQQEGGTDGITLLTIREKLVGRILLGIEEVNSLVAEIDCEADRANQVADRLQDENAGRVRYETLSAIVVAGVAAVASGGALLAGLTALEAAAAIGGGTVAAGLATLPLFAETHQEYSHPRNLLREVWEGPKTSSLVPSSVWRYLTRQTKTELDGSTYRAELIKAWRQEGRLGEPDSDIEQKRLALFFREGGVYELQDLRARAAMLKILASTVELMHQDLEMLIRQVLIQQALAK